jgi:predicted O-methyltransferase YrrM
MSMPIYPSIYDRSLDALGAYDFSRPLFVQACRPPQFDEIVDLLHHRLSLTREKSTLLTSATYPRRSWETAAHVVRADERLSERTASLDRAVEWNSRTVAVITTTVPYGSPYAAMRHNGNIACFSHAIEPLPAILVNAEGQIAAPRRLFEITERQVGGVSLVGNIQISHPETDALYAAALERPSGHVVEVGRFSGGTAMVLATAGRASRRRGITSVDIERLPAAEYFFAVNGLAEDIALLHGDSAALASEWGARTPDPGIALLFIDADHSYDGVVRDLTAWTRYLAPGGVLVLHDVGSPDCGVARAIHYFVANNADFAGLRQVDTMLFCERSRARARAAA